MIKDRIKEAMDKNGINSRELAKRTGLSESAISRYLSGQMEPRAIAVKKLSQVLHADPVWLMDFDEKEIEIVIEPDLTDGLNRESIERLKSYANYLRSIQNKEDQP